VNGARPAGVGAQVSHWRSLTIDAGWRETAEKALEFVKRFT
jgi:hypothetical protein